MSTELSTDVGNANAIKIKAFREQFLKDLPEMARQFADLVAAENSSKAYERYMNVAFKAVEGLQVDPRGGYENLPTINIVFGENFTTTVVKPAAKPITPVPAADIEDVEVKVPTTAKLAAPAMEPIDHDAQDLLDLLSISMTAVEEGE